MQTPPPVPHLSLNTPQQFSSTQSQVWPEKEAIYRAEITRLRDKIAQQEELNIASKQDTVEDRIQQKKKSILHTHKTQEMTQSIAYLEKELNKKDKALEEAKRQGKQMQSDLHTVQLERDTLSQNLLKKANQLNLAQTTVNELNKKLQDAHVDRKQAKNDFQTQLSHQGYAQNENEHKLRKKYDQLKVLVGEYRS